MRSILLSAVLAAHAFWPPGAAAQAAPRVLAPAEALASLPDHRRYRVDLAPADMPREQLRDLAGMIGDAALGQHSYGAVYAFRPVAGGTTEIKTRHGLHSREAAQRGALANCEAARSAKDGACALIGEVLPERWSEATPQLNHVAVQALSETAGQLGGRIVVARSRDGDAFAIHGGGDVREAALAECNGKMAAAGLPADCEVVVGEGGAQ